jgi:hypothetical protein
VHQLVQPAAFEHEGHVVAGQKDRVAFEPEAGRVEGWAHRDELLSALF